MPQFLNRVRTAALRLTGGSPGSNKVIVGDSQGEASWNYVADANVSASAGIQPSKLASGSPNQILRANQTGVPEFAYLPIDVPIGTVIPYMFPTSPVGFLVCDGSTISRATYAELYALANSSGLIGTVFGSGDGSTTFTLPDMRGRTIVGVGTNADVSTLGATDNLAVASRTPKHTHTVPSHTHSIPPHYHSTRSSGADINITSSGTHNHGPGAGTAFLTTAGGAATPSGAFYAGPTATPATTADASHTHANSSFSGRVGLVTGGSNGDLPMTSGAESLTSDVTTVPYIAMNFIIKATYSTLLGDSNAEANEAFTVFMGG